MSLVGVGDGYGDRPPRMGFFTDTSVCIGCKACEVACKTWNAIPEGGLAFTGMSMDNTVGLGADTWRHVAFIEQRKPLGAQDPGTGRPPRTESGGDASRPDRSQSPGVAHGPGVDVIEAAGARLAPADTGRVPVDLPDPSVGQPPRTESGVDASRSDRSQPESGVDASRPDRSQQFRWLMSSDVCKHCTHAACLDVCPTGALFRTEFETVVVQEDVCNGCGYCIPACPYGVIDQRKDDGRAWKCTLCYDRLGVGMEPACAKACPTNSIQFGVLDELRERADARLAQLHGAGVDDARLYGRDPDDGVGGDGAFFLLLDEPEVYGLPPDPVVTTRDLPSMWRHAGMAALALAGAVAAAFLGGKR